MQTRDTHLGCMFRQQTSVSKLHVIHSVGIWLPLTATWLNNQLRFLPEHIENSVVCKRTENLDQFPVARVLSLEDGPRFGRYLTNLKKRFGLLRPYGRHLPLLEKALRELKPDILHTHYGHMGWVNGPLARKYGVRHVVSFYGSDVNYVPRSEPAWYRRYQELGDMADQVLCEGPFMAESISRLGIPREKIRVHRLGIDLGRIGFRPRRYRPSETLRVLIVGSFREKKGVPYALRALAKFRKQGTKINITIIGDAANEREEREKNRILRAIDECELESNVRMLGERPYQTVLSEAYEHHVFLSPSITAQDGDTEGGAPVSIIEMAASGMPVVSTIHCDIPFVLSDLNRPYLVAERDSDALCEALQRLVRRNWEELLAANRTYIEQQLDSVQQGKALETVYRDTIRS